MPDKNQDKKKKAEPTSEAEREKKTSETVNLSAEELRKISGGGGMISPKPGPVP